MGVIEEYRDLTRAQREAARKMVEAAERRRTPRDSLYAARVDALIPLAEEEANDLSGDRPSRRDQFARYAWEQTWTRNFHAAMDALTRVRGLRKQSHQMSDRAN